MKRGPRLNPAAGAAAAVAATAVLALGAWAFWPAPPVEWSTAEIETLESLWIGTLGPPPASPSNAVADDARAARMGHRLFFDERLSGNGEVACATCHRPGRRFTDGRRVAEAIGTSDRNAPSIVGAAYSPWLYWDGRKDSLWSQALEPLEDPDEHGGTRMEIARVIAGDAGYRETYEALFGALPELSDRSRFPAAAAPVPDTQAESAWRSMTPADRERVTEVYVNVGKAIAAYERLLVPGPARFDAYVEAVMRGDEAAQREIFSESEARGLELFIGEAQCTRCHNGPLLTNNEFHNTGVLSAPGEVPDVGRIDGVRTVMNDPFNCLGPWNDDATRRCPELRFARKDDPALLGSVRTPSLRNLDGTQPYMHKGQIPTLDGVLTHYNRAADAMIGHNEAEPLGLDAAQLEPLEDFLGTLAAPPAAAPRWLSPPRGTPHR